MIYLVYVSSATKLFTEDELLELLQKARTNNQRDGITGMLLYSNGNFIQVIEGDEDAVLSLHNRILSDPRHTRIITLLQRPLTKRMFAEWSMGFRNLDLAPEEMPAGFTRFLAESDDSTGASANGEIVYKLLLNFRRTMR